MRFISKKLIKGIRPHELVILSCLIYNRYFTASQVEKYLYETYGLENQFESIKSAINILSMNFYRKETSDDYQANTIQFVSIRQTPYSSYHRMTLTLKICSSNSTKASTATSRKIQTTDLKYPTHSGMR